MRPRHGRLITVEGVTGVGKSTLFRRLRSTSRATRDLIFAGGYFGQQPSTSAFHGDLLSSIRRQLRRDEFLRLDWRVECLVLQAELLLADGFLVRPALESGKTILYEHHQHSILVYQAARLVESGVYKSVARGLKSIISATAPFARAATPDVTVFLDFDSADAAVRAARRDKRRVTKRARIFNELVAAGYHDLYRRYGPASLVRVSTFADALACMRRLTA